MRGQSSHFRCVRHTLTLNESDAGSYKISRSPGCATFACDVGVMEFTASDSRSLLACLRRCLASRYIKRAPIRVRAITALWNRSWGWCSPFLMSLFFTGRVRRRPGHRGSNRIRPAVACSCLALAPESRRNARQARQVPRYQGERCNAMAVPSCQSSYVCCRYERAVLHASDPPARAPQAATTHPLEGESDGKQPPTTARSV
jgi:hypothetical protein